MSEPLTLKQVEHLVAQLHPQDQLKLVAGVCDRLSLFPEILPDIKPTTDEEEAAFLKDIEETAALWQGEFDSAADIRRIRGEGK